MSGMSVDVYVQVCACVMSVYLRVLCGVCTCDTFVCVMCVLEQVCGVSMFMYVSGI